MKPARKIFHRLKRETRNAWFYARAQIFNTMPSEEDVVKAWDSPSPVTFPSCVEAWMESKPRVWSAAHESWKTEASLLKEAHACLEHRIPILGQSYEFSLPAVWREDPVTHQTWPLEIHFTRFKVFHPSRDGVTDIRRLWEVGRFGWALPLAQAHVRHGRPEYADAWANCVENFILHNPPEFGPHWLNAMEAALRAIQWCRAIALFLEKEDSLRNHPALPLLLRSLLAHGRYIRSHLEWTPYGRTNHYIADLAGLLAIAVFVPQFKESAEWKRFARQRLMREIDIQTDRDGFHSEASTAYHHFVLELYTLVLGMDEQHRLDFSARFRDRVLEMRRTDARLRGPEDLDPRIGDDDSGTMHLPELGMRNSELGRRKAESGVEKESFALRESGIYILRSADLSCHVSCGPNGQQGVGGHAHNDKLSVTLRAGGRPVIVDAGTFVYSSDTALRDHFRSTPMHNTLTVDGLEQNPFKDWRMLRDRAHARRLVWKDSPEETFFMGEHRGYRPAGAVHRRTLQLDKRRHHLTVLDEVETRGIHRYDFRLHFDASLTLKDLKLEANRVVFPNGDLIFGQTLPFQWEETAVSPIYGTRVKNLTLHFQVEAEGPWRLSWEFRAKKN